jgi:oligopeptidase B
MQAPKAPQIPFEITTHSHLRIDNYYWMNDRENPALIEYLNKENNYTQDQLKDTKELQQQLFDEIVSRIKKDDSSVPYFYEGDYYYSRYEDGKEHPIYCTKPDLEGNDEQIILDVNLLAQDQAFCDVASYALNSSKSAMVYGVDYLSRRIYTLYFKNMADDTLWDLKIENMRIGPNAAIIFFIRSKIFKLCVQIV